MCLVYLDIYSVACFPYQNFIVHCVFTKKLMCYLQGKQAYAAKQLRKKQEAEAKLQNGKQANGKLLANGHANGHVNGTAKKVQ